MLINKTTENMEANETKTVTINGINYVILAEEPLTGKAAEIQTHYVSMLMLRRPKGTKEFWGMRTVEGNVELN